MAFRPRRLLLSVVVGVSLAGWWLPSLATAQSSSSTVQSLGDDPLEVKAEEDKGDADTALTLLNTGSVSLPISIEFQGATNETSVHVGKISPRTLPPHQATRVVVQLTGLAALKEDLQGQLVVDAGDSVTARAATISPAPQPKAPWPQIIIFGSFAVVVFMFFAVIGWMDPTKRKFLWARAPTQGWKFDSWATTLTAAGAIFGTVLGKVTLPEAPEQIDKETLTRMSLLFGVLLVVGPFLLSAIRPNKADAADQETGLTGFSIVLIFATALTYGAVTGEMATLALLSWELFGGGADAILAVASVIAIWGIATRYFLLTAKELAETDWVTKAKKAVEEDKAEKPAAAIKAKKAGQDAGPVPATPSDARLQVPLP
jgi:hypothetical protein